MIPLRRIDRALARECIDYRTGGVSATVADAQLDGAVAIHNILADHNAAYLADEVGMGKTYVALGVVALIRALHPELRVLYIAPRANIQRKWCDRELQNFVLRAWKLRDQRVRALDGQPAAPFVVCDRLVDWAHKATRNPDRDVFLRMTSFSVGLRDAADGKEGWHALRHQLLQVAPFMTAADMDARTNDKEEFKESFGRALNRLIPHYDLVVVDEAHNLKHGPLSGSTRNRMLATVLGGTLDSPRVKGEPPRRRFDRVLFLSATPLETDFSDLGNQLSLFGFDQLAEPLHSASSSDDDEEAKRAHAHRFVLRRPATVRLAGQTLAKTEYRRSWYGGGVESYDSPLPVPSLQQKLIVALMQKKVSELIKKRFNAQFQIGMLASFESFAESTSEFDDAEQTDDETEREGIDAHIVTRIAKSYRRKFREPMPHPKMQSVVAELARAMENGDKSLVFVRRVRSVDELGELLCRAYDCSLKAANDRPRPLLPPHLHSEWTELWKRYDAEREKYFARRRLFDAQRTRKLAEDSEAANEEIEPAESQRQDADTGGYDTFFSWFFRGEPREGMLSGAAFRRNRLDNEGAALHLLFEDNHIAALLDDPPDVLRALVEATGLPSEHALNELRGFARGALARVRGTPHRSQLFKAFQEAALQVLSKHGRLRDEATVALHDWFPLANGQFDTKGSAQDPAEYLGIATFFSRLRQRPALCARLWPDDAPKGSSFRERFRRRTLRRLLIASMMRLGHPMIDLWALGVRHEETLTAGKRRTRDHDSLDAFASELLDLLEQQLAEPRYTSARELNLLAENFDLLMQTNFPKLTHAPLHAVTAGLARVLRRQTPIAGLTGSHRSETAIQQFRMPGYPFVLIATDILQEGEDLHTFCGRILHYGLSWTPSSTEQRTGRIDRIGSLIHRRLESNDAMPNGDDCLQIYYPYLGDTIERLQAQRVFARLERFIQLTTVRREVDKPWVNVDEEFTASTGLPTPASAPRESAFPLRETDLVGEKRFDRSDEERSTRALALFGEHLEHMSRRIRVDWEAADHDARRFGTVHLRNGEPLSPDATDATRIQPVALYLRADGRGDGSTLHVVSPIAKLPGHERTSVAELQDDCTDAKLTETDFDEPGTSLFAAEVQIRFHPDDSDAEEMFDAICRAVTVADRIERTLTDRDRGLASFRPRLLKDAKR